jgi:uncharacterized protein
MNQIETLRRNRQTILQLAARHGARNIRLFGSVVRGDARETSDVDFLVDMEKGRSLLDLAGLELDLKELLGTDVDVVVEGGLSPYLEKRILAEAIAL